MGFNISSFHDYHRALDILSIFVSGKSEAIQNYGNGGLQRLMMRVFTGTNSSILHPFTQKSNLDFQAKQVQARADRLRQAETRGGGGGGQR